MTAKGGQCWTRTSCSEQRHRGWELLLKSLLPWLSHTLLICVDQILVWRGNWLLPYLRCLHVSLVPWIRNVKKFRMPRVEGIWSGMLINTQQLSLQKGKKKTQLIFSFCQFLWCKYSSMADFKLPTRHHDITECEAEKRHAQSTLTSCCILAHHRYVRMWLGKRWERSTELNYDGPSMPSVKM